jgi:hypothetical protein
MWVEREYVTKWAILCCVLLSAVDVRGGRLPALPPSWPKCRRKESIAARAVANETQWPTPIKLINFCPSLLMQSDRWRTVRSDRGERIVHGKGCGRSDATSPRGRRLHARTRSGPSRSQGKHIRLASPFVFGSPLSFKD